MWLNFWKQYFQGLGAQGLNALCSTGLGETQAQGSLLLASQSRPPTFNMHTRLSSFHTGLAGPWRDHSRVMRQLAPCILPAGTNPGPQGICPLLFFQLASLPRAHPARNRAQLLAARLPTSVSRKGSGGWRSRGRSD